MKTILYLLLLAIVIFSFPQHASAGFFVKKQVTATNMGNPLVAKAEMRANNAIAKHPANLLSYYNQYKQNSWYGIASVFAGVLGLFIPGVNFLAILFGVLGMGRKCKQPGLAIAGFVIGMIELAIFIFTSSTLLALILF